MSSATTPTNDSSSSFSFSLSSARLAKRVRRSTLGDDLALPSPLGPRKLTWADGTASGRAVGLVEDAVRSRVLPLLANAHTTTSFVGATSGGFVEEARAIARDAVRADERDALVLFVGRGATEASVRLAHYVLPARARAAGGARAGGDAPPPCAFPGCGRELATVADAVLHARAHGGGGEASLWVSHPARPLAPAAAEGGGGPGGAAAGAAPAGAAAAAAAAHAAAAEGATVLVCPRAHHSSFLPWREAGATLLPLELPSLAEAAQGLGVSLASILRGALAHDARWEAAATAAAAAAGAGAGAAARRARRPPLVVLLTAGSNVTGEGWSPEGAARASAAAHALGGIDVWDAAAAAPHALPSVDGSRGALSWPAILGLRGGEGALERAGCGGELVAAAVSLSSRLAAGAAGAGGEGARAWPTHKDALFFSTHKFPGGGGGTPGVLVLRRALLAAGPPPFLPGGGTVFFVDPAGAPVYAARDAEREEGGSPDVAGAARAGLVLRLHAAVGPPAVAAREAALVAAAARAWARHPNIIVHAGAPPCAAPRGARLPVVALSILAPAPAAGGGGAQPRERRLRLHWALVCALLSDVFGIQARGGCLCAGPFAAALLGVSPPVVAAGAGAGAGAASAGGAAPDTGAAPALLDSLLARDELLRPGVVRVSFSYAMSAAEAAFVIAAVAWVASHGADALGAGLYAALPETGEWRAHRAKAAAAAAAGRRAAGARGAAAAGVIAALTEAAAGGGGGPLGAADDVGGAGAARGAARAQPRAWLAGVSFLDAPASAGASGAGASAPGAAPGTGAARVTAVSECDHAALLLAYAAEARELALGLRPRAAAAAPPSSATSGGSGGLFPLVVPGWSGGDAVSLAPDGLLSPAGAAARWFALPCDLEPASATANNGSNGGGGGGGALCLSRAGAAHGGPARSFPHAPAAHGCAHDGACVLAATDDVGRALDAAVATFSSAMAVVSPAGADSEGAAGVAGGRPPEHARVLAAWDGDDLDEAAEAAVVAEEETAGAAREKEDAADDATAAVAPPAPAPAPSPAPAPPSLSPASALAPARAAAAPPSPPAVVAAAAAAAAAVVDAAASAARFVSLPPHAARARAPAASPPAPGAPSAALAPASRAAAAPRAAPPPLPPLPPSSLTPLEYVWRRARLAATTAALAALPEAPPAVSRALAHALKRAILQFDMLRPGDRVLVGLSGGKDSLCLLLQLLRLQAVAPVFFDVGAATVDPGYEGAFDPSPLAAWARGLGVEYTIEAVPVLALAASKNAADSLCSFCSRLKRGVLYGAARRRGYNVLALGQHADDFAESFVMSAFQNGALRTMKAHYANGARDVRVVRPLVYARERDTRAYAAARGLPVIPENCPGCYVAPTVRVAVKRLLAREESRAPTLFASLARAMQPLVTNAGAAAVRAAARAAGGGGGGGGEEGDDDDDDGDGDGIGGGGGGGAGEPAAEDEAGATGVARGVVEDTAGVAPAGFVPAALRAPPAAPAPDKGAAVEERAAEDDEPAPPVLDGGEEYE